MFVHSDSCFKKKVAFGDCSQKANESVEDVSPTIPQTHSLKIISQSGTVTASMPMH